MTEPPEIVAYRREREAMRRQMHERLEQIREAAMTGDLTQDQLRAEVLGVMHTYVPGAAGTLKPALNNLIARYAELTNDQERLRVLEDLLQSLGG